MRTLLRLGRALVDVYCGSFRQVPKRIVVDVDDTFDAVHGGQQLRLFNAHYDDYGFQPIVVFDGEGARHRRPAPGEAAEGRRHPRLSPAPGRRDPRQLAAGGHPAARRQPLRLPQVLDWCEANGVDYVLGLAPTNTLKRHVGGLEESTSARFKATPVKATPVKATPVKATPGDGKMRRFEEFFDAADSWSRIRR